MTQPDVQATLQVRFVDDDALVRTGRALLEVDGHGWVVVPVPAGWAGQVQAVLNAAEDADTISTFVEAAEAAAESAEADRVVVEQAAMSASWSGDQLTVLGATSPPLTGETGPAGATPHVGENGNWWVGDTDTGVQAQGEKGLPGDGAGDVLWSELNPVLDGKAEVGHRHSWEQVDEKPATFPPTIGTTPDTAAAGDHSHTAAEVGAAPAEHTHSQYATTAQVEARTPEIRIVSSPDLATSPGVLYVVRED